MLDHLLKHVVQHVWHAVAEAGVRKFSGRSGRKAKQVEAAARVAEDFVSALRKGALGTAKSYCTVSLREQLGGDSLKKFFGDIDPSSAAWKLERVDDSSEHNKWALCEITFFGLLVGAKVRRESGSVDAPLKLVLGKEGEEWKILGLYLF
jgi:hypothetical protein